MKNKLIALLIKFILTFFAAWLSFGYIGGNTTGWVFWSALLPTLLNYFIFDLMILPSFGNITSSALEGLIAALSAFLISLLAGGTEINNQITNVFNTNLLTLVFFGVVVAVMEYFFHIYFLQGSMISSNKDNLK